MRMPAPKMRLAGALDPSTHFVGNLSPGLFFKYWFNADSFVRDVNLVGHLKPIADPNVEPANRESSSG